MAKTSFAAASRPPEVVEEVVAETTEIVETEVPTQALAINIFEQQPLGSFQGSIERADLAIPELKLCQNIGPLVEEYDFKPGQFVVKKEVAVWSPDSKQSLRLLFLRVKKRWLEKTVFGSGIISREFNTMEDADAAGLRTNWLDDQPPEVEPILRCMVLVEQPKEVDSEIFDLKIGSKRYIKVLYSISGNSYREQTGGRKLIADYGSMLSKAGGYHTYFCEAKAVKRKGTKNTYWAPIFQFTQKLEEAQLAEVQKLD